MPGQTARFGPELTQSQESGDVLLRVAHPLMRGAGTAVNLAAMRIAVNERRADVHALEQQALAVGASVERAWWGLAYAEQLLAVRREALEQALPLLLDNPGAHERMEGTGHVRRALARDFGLVGPAGRASGLRYDVPHAFKQEPWASTHAAVHVLEAGDVLARVQIRALETRTSLQLIHRLLTGLGPCATPRAKLPERLRADSFGIGMVEAWRGELIRGTSCTGCCWRWGKRSKDRRYPIRRLRVASGRKA